MDKPACLHCSGHRSITGLGTKIPDAMQHDKIKKLVGDLVLEVSLPLMLMNLSSFSYLFCLLCYCT